MATGAKPELDKSLCYCGKRVFILRGGRDNAVCEFARRLDELIVHGFNLCEELAVYAVWCAAALFDVALKAALKAELFRSVEKN